MGCELVETSLVDFHFGRIAPSERELTETHLRSCPRCLGAFLGLKRDIEESQLSISRPSSQVRESLHAEARARFAGVPAAIASQVTRRRAAYFTLGCLIALGAAHFLSVQPPPAPPAAFQTADAGALGSVGLTRF
jgi:hypothetical protein